MFLNIKEKAIEKMTNIKRGIQIPPAEKKDRHVSYIRSISY